MQYMYDIRDMLCRELSDISKKGELTAGSLDTVDKITHAIKSIDTILAMDNYSEDHDASYRKDYSRGSYDRHRDTLGRYCSERYSNGRYSKFGETGGFWSSSFLSDSSFSRAWYVHFNYGVVRGCSDIESTLYVRCVR